MMIDSHAHLWPPQRTPDAIKRYFEKRGIGDKIAETLSAEGLLKKMELCKISRCIVSATPLLSGLKNEELSLLNEYVYNEIQKADKKLVGFCTVDPYGGEASIEIVRDCIENKGFRGLKLHPSIQKFYPNEDKLYRLYTIMQEYEMPILFHTGAIGITPFKDKYSNSDTLDEVASDFPELKIIMGHGGRPCYDQATILMRKHQNLYTDISAIFGRLKELSFKPLEWFLYKIKIYTGGFDKVLFGSDYPFYFQDETYDLLINSRISLNEKYDGFIGEEDFRKIIGKNGSELLENLNDL